MMVKAETYTPLFGRGDVAIEIDGKVISLSLTPRVCALLEDRFSVDSYLDALTDFSESDGSGTVRIKAKRALAIGETLFEANGADPELCNHINPVDLAVLISRLLTAHIRPVDNSDPQKAAADIV
jgi:hypothetical protein